MKKLGYDYHISQGETFTINETYHDVIYPQLTNPRVLVTVVSSSFAVNKRVICRKWLPLTLPSPPEGRDITINCNFTTEDTCWWRSQRYTYFVSIIDGKLTSQWLRELCETYHVQTSDDNKTMYDNLVKAGIVFNKEFDYDAPLTQITYNQPLGYPSTIYVTPSAYVTDTFVKQEQPTPPTPTEMFNLVRSVEHGTVKVYLNGTEAQDGKVLLAGDVLTFEVIPETNYVVTSFKINGQDFDNSVPYIVTGDTSVVARCVYYEPSDILYMLSKYTYEAIVTVTRNGAVVPTGRTLHRGDVITVTAQTTNGNEFDTLTINNSPITSPITLSVYNDINIVAIAKSDDEHIPPRLRLENSSLFVTIQDDADIVNVYVENVIRGTINTVTGEFVPI